MSENSDNLKEKPCRCGDVMGEVIGFNECLIDNTYQPYRVGWYCVKCKEFEQAILRERQI